MDILKTNKTTVLSCIGAMGLHLLLLILFFYGMSHAVQNRVRSGEQNVKVISSFLYVQKMDGHRYTTSTPKENKAKDQQSFVKQEPLNAINTHVSTLRPVLTKTNSAKLQEKKQSTAVNNDLSATDKRIQSNASNGAKVSELLKLLHVAIQKHQHYPANALQLNKQGRVTLAFTLLTNGYVSNLTVLKSSGVPSLDEAAIAAVKEAVPFSGLEQYLNEAKAFHIDVVFDLGSYDV